MFVYGQTFWLGFRCILGLGLGSGPISELNSIRFGKVREKQNKYGIFFPILFFISKAFNMRWKKLTYNFSERAFYYLSIDI